jgi:transposase-like protein
MDTTYFGRKFGVMVFMDSFTGQVLYKQYVKNETNALYFHGIEEIVRRGISVQSIICDGRKGIFAMFPDIPCQLCQFHQVKTITRYLTRKPKLEAAVELRALALQLTKTDKESYTHHLQMWKNKWDKFLNERTVSATTGKSFYTHKRLRSAYFSIKRNIPYLFVFQDYKELAIPNTTNMLDGTFADLKNKLRNHNGLNMTRKKRFVDEFFKA